MRSPDEEYTKAVAEWFASLEAATPVTTEVGVRLVSTCVEARRIFHREVLGSGFAMQFLTEELGDIANGRTNLDKWLEPAPRENDTCVDHIAGLRLCLERLLRLLASGRNDMAQLLSAGVANAKPQGVLRRIARTRGQMRRLVDGLRLRHNRVRPLLDLIEARAAEMQQVGFQLRWQTDPAEAETSRHTLRQMQIEGLDTLPALQRRARRARLAYDRLHDARGDLVHAHSGWIVSLVRQFHQPGADLPDEVQKVSSGLILACHSFDPHDYATFIALASQSARRFLDGWDAYRR